MCRAESRGRLLQRRWRFLAMRLLVVGVTIGGLTTTVPAGNPSDQAHPPASSNEAPTRERRPAGSAEDPAPVLVHPDQPNVIAFAPQPARLVRLVIHAAQGEPCIDELEIYGPAGKDNLALARRGASATASSCLAGHAIHQIRHLNDGKYGNDRSWIAASGTAEWAQIELAEPAVVAQVVFSRDRKGQYRDRLPVDFDIQISLDGRQWNVVRTVRNAAPVTAGGADRLPRARLPVPLTWSGLLRYAFLCERETWDQADRADHLSPYRVDRPARPGGKPYWGQLIRMDAVARTLKLQGDLIDRLAAKGLDVTAERTQLAALRTRQLLLVKANDEARAADSLYFDARWAKRQLMLRDPDLEQLQRIVFVKRHPYEPSHNYSDYLDAKFRGGGGICVLEMPRCDGRLDPAKGTVSVLFDARDGIARDPTATFDAATVYFAYRPAGSKGEVYWNLMRIESDGSGLRQLTDGPFHDYYPCPLPDGGVAFVSTRCKCRYLCWVPMSCVLYRMEADGFNLRPLSHANLSEWGPTVMRDGRILWTRSEYLDKGADFGHTLWAVGPDGRHPTLIFGNNTTNCYMNAHEVPGTREICCTLISHGGDFNGPIGLIDLSRGPLQADAITNITPDVRPRYHMDWARSVCFRDPMPISSDYMLVSHAPADRFGLYVIDRYGNRELLYLDPAIGSMSASPLRSVAVPPQLPTTDPPATVAVEQPTGQFIVADVYQGLTPAVKRGRVKYLRVCQEVRADLERLPNGKIKEEYPPFQDYYAAPTHKINGPHGWPSFVAKAALGIVPVEADGSVSFIAPAGKVLYFQLLDEQFNEVQRMRSVVQLQRGEVRGCVGCHENRSSAPAAHPLRALDRPPRRLQAPPWGAEPFSYAKVVQPVWNDQCAACHQANDEAGINLTGTLDADRVPASYRTLISQGWVHHFTYAWSTDHHKAEPLTFGTIRSKLWDVLDGGHYGAVLTSDQERRIKCWIDLNCPLWPDYQYRLDRPEAAME